MAIVADSFEPAGRPVSSAGALPLSLALHGLLLVGALWLFNRPAPQETPELESVSVSIIAMETATEIEPATERSDASQTLLAAGSTTPVTATPVEAVDSSAAVPVETEAQRAEVETAVRLRTDMALPAPPVATAEAMAPDALPPVEQVTAASAELAAFAEPLSAAPAETTPAEMAGTAVAVPADATATPPADVVDPVPERSKPPPAKPIKKAEAAKPKPPPKPKPASTGSGGDSDANAQASASSSGGAGRLALGGSAAESRYPGLVQAKLRRALRFPPNAGAASGKALVRFLVAADGSVSGISVVGSTGSSILDAAALDTVRRAAPFPPIPQSAGRSTWSFTLPLQFRH